MSELPRSQLIVYIAAALAVALVGARYLREASTASPSTPRAPAYARASGTASRATDSQGASGVGGVAIGAENGPVIVQVVGHVRNPGVLRLRSGDRVDDAVRRAGGATNGADLAGVNLAAKVLDGQQIVVPGPGAAGVATAGAVGSSLPGAAGAAAPAAAPVSLNTATVEQLDALDGVGPETARKILAYRQQHGGFRSVSELDQVSGIGEKKMASLRAQVKL